MQKDLQKQIDLLIEMSGAENNYDAIIEELNEVEQEITIKKTEVKNVKKSMTNGKYAKDNDRIIDENIKIGLENKQSVYQYELDKVMKQLNKASLDEEDIHNSLTSTINRLKSLRSLIEVLEGKLKSVQNNEELTNFYESMIEKTDQEIDDFEHKKNILSKQYKEVSERLEHFGKIRMELDEKLQHLKTRLEDTLTALNTPNFYVDQVLKQKDESLVDELNQELDDLEKHRLSLITDPVYIGHEALKLYEEDDLPATLGRIKELVTIVKTKPYMTNQNIEIKGLLEQAETNLEEFANEMDNNNYLGEDTKIIEQRIEYLNQNIANLKKQEEEIIQKINDIDQKDVVAISNLLNNVENVYDKLKDEYEEYKNVIFQLDDDVSPRKKATLQSAYNRKKEEMDAVYKIYNSYQLELEKDVMKSSSLETTELTKVKEEIEKITKEVEELKKQKQGKTKIKDVLAIEKDKEKLKELSDKVEAIKHRQKYDQLPDEIYNDIEALLTGKARKEEDIKTPIINDDELVDLDEFRIEKLDDKEASPILDEIILEDKKEDKEEEKDEPQEETKIEDTKEINEKVLQIASEEQEKSSYPSRRIKVVKVEELKKEEPKEVLPIEEEISIPNLEEENKEEIESLNLNEDEYLNFNDILNGDYNEN